MKSRLNLVASLLLAIALLASSAYADEGQNSVSSSNWIYSVTLGIAEWQDLGGPIYVLSVGGTFGG